VTAEQRTFERLYAEHRDAVLRYCLRRTSRDDAAEAASETFVIAWRRREAIPSGFELPWLYRVASNVLANQLRSNRRRASATRRLPRQREASDDPEGQVVRSEEAREVVAAIERLAPADRELLRLAGWERLDRSEIAVALDCTPNAVTKRMGRALDGLARELGVDDRSHRSRFFSTRTVHP
jgi:RNA polymerase sigma-70 factor (ECF subfamily)